MTLRDDMALDAGVIADENELAELVTYRPPAPADPITDLPVIVNRNPPGPDGQFRGLATTHYEVFVPRGRLDSVNEGFDLIDIETVHGDGEPEPRRVTHMISVDGLWWRLHCQL